MSKNLKITDQAAETLSNIQTRLNQVGYWCDAGDKMPVSLAHCLTSLLNMATNLGGANGATLVSEGEYSLGLSTKNLYVAMIGREYDEPLPDGVTQEEFDKAIASCDGYVKPMEWSLHS